MGRRPKTPAELHADLQIFEVAWKREMAHFMRNAVERMITPGSGRRMSARYKIQLPRFTTTVLEPSLNPGVAASAARQPSQQPHVISRRRTRKKPPPQPGENRRIRTAENLELRRLLANAVERTRAFRDRGPMPARLEMTFVESPDATGEMRSYQDALRSASETLLEGLTDL
jgi:hypothetical protein